MVQHAGAGRVFAGVRRAGLLLVVALGVAFGGCGAAAFAVELSPEEAAFVREHPVWRLSGASSPPFQWIDPNGQFRGVAADYKKIIEAKLGVRLELRAASTWDASLEELRRGECDVSLLTAQTPERSEFLRFTEPLLDLPLAIIMRGDDSPVNEIADLSGRRVAVARGRPIHERLKREHRNIILLPRDDVGSALSAVALGDAEAYVGDLASATDAIYRLGVRNLRIAGETSYTFPFRIAVRKDWPEAVSILDKAIAEITPEEHAAIRRRWIEVRGTGLTLKRVLSFGIPAAIALVALTLLLVNQRLAREIAHRKTSEAALRESKERWLFALDGSRDGVWDWDVETGEVFFSKRFKTMLEFSEGDLPNGMEEWTSRVHPDERDFLDDVLQRHLRGETPSFEIEHRLQAKDGSYRWILARGRVVSRAEDGTPRRMVGTHTDITERKRSEQALQTAKEFAEALIQTANAIVLGLDARGNITIFNEAAEKITGYTKAELAHRNWWEALVPRERFPEVWTGMEAQLVAGGMPKRCETPFLTKSGEERYIVWQNGEVREAGRVVGTVSFGIDMTARRRAEDDLRRHREQLEETVRTRTEELERAERGLRQITDNIPGAVYQFVKKLDGSFAFTFCSEGMEAMVGVSCETAVRDVNSVWQVIAPADLESLVERANHSAESLTHYVQDLRICQADGRSWWIQAEAVPQRQPDGTTLWNGNIIDITERKRLEEELAKSKRVADSANQAKSAFLANMSHEIRTPMNAILGFSQLLLRDPLLTPEQRQHLDTVNRSGEHLLALINDILEISKIEAGRVALVNTSFDLHALLDDLERMFRLRAETRGLRFTVERAIEVPQFAKGDESKLRQILINLIGNAVKFTVHGGIAVRITSEHEPGGALRLRGEVEDTGPGIAEEDLPRLFRQFEQTETGRRAAVGTGLGLAISREFARLMGGEMSVTSTIGCGTTFRFEVLVEESEPIPRVSAGGRRVVRLRPSHLPMRVLIADDKAENRELLEHLLRPIGFETRAVENGTRAIEVFAEWHPHIALFDLRMPGVDGYEVIRRIREMPDGTETPIIAVTASAFEENRREVIAAGGDDFLGKPFRERELFEKIQRLTGAEYIHEDEAPESDSRRPSALSQEEVITALPAELRARLREAVVSADFDQMIALIEEADLRAPEIARELRSRVERFEYQALLILLEGETLPV